MLSIVNKPSFHTHTYGAQQHPNHQAFPAQTSDSLSLHFLGSKKTQEAQLPREYRNLDLSKVKIFSGRSNPKLAKEVADYLGKDLSGVELKSFSNGETYVKILENVRGCDTFVIQSTSAPANDNLMEALLMIDALKRASAKSITVVIPHYGYARQDRRADRREPISAKLVADMLKTAGATHVVIVDPHSNQMEGFFNIPVDNLPATPLTAGYVKNKKLKNLVVVSPDEGGAKRARSFAEILKTPFAMIDKRRKEHNKAEALGIVGEEEVKGRVALIVDDMIDTAGTLCEAAKLLMQKGATKVLALATHPVLSGLALKRIQESKDIDEVIVTDTIPLTPEGEQVDKISQITVAPIIGEAIARIVDDGSVSDIASLGI